MNINKAKLNFCKGKSEAYQEVLADLSTLLASPEDDSVSLRTFLERYKTIVHDKMIVYLDKAIEAFNEEE